MCLRVFLFFYFTNDRFKGGEKMLRKSEVTATEASRMLGVGRQYVYELLCSGLIRGRQVMGRWLIRVDEIERYRHVHPRVGKTIRARQEACPVGGTSRTNPLPSREAIA